MKKEHPKRSIPNLLKILLTVVWFFSCQNLWAACGSTDYTWAGNNTNWNTAGNWSPNGIPDTADENVILTPINNLNIEQHTIGCFDVSSGRLRSTAGGPVLTVTGDYFRALNANTISFQNNHNVVIEMAGTGNQTFEAVDIITYLEISNNNLVRITQPGRIRKGLTFTGTGSVVQIEGQGQLQLDAATTIPAGITVKVMNGATLYIRNNLTINGTLNVESGGTLMFTNGRTITVNSGGELNLNGASGNVASVVTDGANRYIYMNVSGTFSAEYFRIEGLRNAGLNFTGATVSKLENGEFRNGRTNVDYITVNNSTTLPSTMDGLGFYDDYSYGNLININANSYNGSSVTLDNYGGDLAGDSFEVDPNNRFDWQTASATKLSLTNNSSANQPGNSTSPGEGELVYAILSFSLTDADTATSITSMTVSLDGTGLATDIEYVRIYEDTNGNCAYDAGTDTQIGSDQTLSGSPGSTTFTISSGTVETSGPSDAACVIVTAKVADSAGDGNFLRLGVEQTGDVTNSAGYDFATISGPPVYGNQTMVNNGTQSKWDGSNSSDWTANNNWLGQAPTQGNDRSCEIGLGANVTQISANPVYCLNADLLSNGTIDWQNSSNVFIVNGTLDVDSGFTFTNAGNAIFSFEGSGDQNISMSEEFPGDIEIDNTGNTVNIIEDSLFGGDLTIIAGTLSITDGVTLTIDGNIVVQNGGTLELGAGSIIEFANGSSLTVNTGGALNLLGSGGSSAILRTQNSTDSFNVVVNGTVAANNYRIENLGTSGFSVESGATIDGTNHFQNGIFSDPVGSNGTFLFLKRQVPGNTIDNIIFAQGSSSGTGTTNIDTTGAAAGTLSVANYSGDLAGPSNDNDPTYAISWSGATNTIAATVDSSAPGNLEVGETEIVGSLRLIQTQAGASFNDSDITSLKIELSGTGTSSDIDSVKIYRDTNCDNAGGVLIGTETLTGNPAAATFTITGGDLTVEADVSTPPEVCVYFEFDVSSSATGNNTVGVTISASGDLINSEGYTYSTSFPLSFGTGTILASTETTWTGSTNTDWNNAGNWSDGVPSAIIDCIIPTTATDPTISTGSAFCNNITIEAGGELTLSGSATLEINGSYSNTGTFNQTGTLKLVDNIGIDQYITTSSTLQNLTIEKSINNSRVFMGTNNITINNLDFGTGGSYRFFVTNGQTLSLPNGLDVDNGFLAILNGATVEIGNGQELTVSGGTLYAVGGGEAWPQTETNKAKITALGGGTNRWGFNATSGDITLTGFHLDRMDTDGLVIGGTADLLSFGSGQFTNLSTNYSSVKAIQLNTTGSLPSTANQVYWTWGDFNDEGTDANDDGIPDAPTPANTENYQLVSSTGCNSQTIDFTNWTGDWFEAAATFDVDTKVSASGCTINMSSAQSAVDLEYLRAENFDGAVDIHWSTIVESNHLGFNVYRSSIDGSNFTRLNNFLILNFNSSGLNRGVYRFTDNDVENGEVYQYFIEDVEADLVTTSLHGPVLGQPQSGLGTPGSTDDGVNDGSNPSDGDNPTTPGGDIQNPSFKDLGDGVVILSQTSTNLKIKADLLNFSQSAAAWNGSYTVLSASGYGHTLESGYPEALHRTLLIRVDSFVSTASLVNIEVTESTFGPLSLSPVPTYTANGSGTLVSSYNPNATAYSSDQFYPEQYANVESSIISVGNEKFLKVNLHPSLFKADTGDLKVATEMTLTISLNDGDWSEPTPTDENLENPYTTANTLRIFYPSKGLYQVSFQDMVQTHTDSPFEGADIDDLRLYRKNEEIPLHLVDSNSDGFFNSNDQIVFYGAYDESLDDSMDSVVLSQTDVMGSGDPVRMDIRDGDADQAQFSEPIGIFESSHEENEEYFTETSIGDELDHFFSARLFSYTGLDSYTFSHDLPFLDINDEDYLVTIKVHLKANYTWFGANTDSNLELYINDMSNRVADIDYQGNGRMVISFEVDPAEFSYPTNTFKLRSSGANLSGDYEFSYIDKVTFEVVGRLEADNDTIPEVSVENDFSYEVTGFSGNDIWAFDVTDPSQTAKIENFDITTSDGGTTYDAEIFIGSDNSSDYLSKVIISKTTEIAQVSSLQLSNGYYESLKDTSLQYDYLVIGVPSLLNSVTDLVEHRADQGLRVKTITLDQIYAEFSHSRISAQAIKDFLNYANNNWAKPAPKYVLFLGDATYNPKAHDVVDDEDKVSLQAGTWPLRIRDGRYWDFGDDHFFITPSGSDVPFIASGRIPSNNPVSISDYVQKVLNYESGDLSPNTDNLQIPFFSDLDQDNEKFEQKTTELKALEGWEQNSFEGVLYSHDQLPEPQMKQGLIDSFSEGNFLINFFGHGATNQLGDGLFDLDDVDDLTNEKLPLFMSLNCENAYFYDDDKNEVSFGEAIVLKKTGGAIAFMGSSAWTTPTSQDRLARQFYQQLHSSLKEGRYEDRLGLILQRAKAGLATDSYSKDSVRSFMLIGDPALKIPAHLFTAPTPPPPPPPVFEESRSSGCSLVAGDGSQIPWHVGFIEWIFYALSIFGIRRIRFSRKK